LLWQNNAFSTYVTDFLIADIDETLNVSPIISNHPTVDLEAVHGGSSHVSQPDVFTRQGSITFGTLWEARV
jgi:hypothetical protein